MTHTDIQNKINAGETCIDLPAEEIALPVPLATAGKRIQFNGKGRLETTLIPTTYAIDSTSQSITLNDVGIRGASPTSCGVLLSGLGGDIEASGCGFYSLRDALYADWVGGFIRASNSRFENIGRRAIFGKSSGYWALQTSTNYFDGRQSDGLIQVEGILAGGIIENSWMQASLAHIVVNGLVNELVIEGNMLDQDTASIACVIVNGGGNCIKISDNFIASLNIGVLCQSASNVDVTLNRFRQRGADAAIVFNGAQSDNNLISDNKITVEGTARYGIVAAATSMTGFQVNRNSSHGNSQTLLAVAGDLDRFFVKDNTPNGDLLEDYGATGQAVCVGNSSWDQPYLGIVAADEVSLPFADQSRVIGITASGIPITKMTGVTARAGVNRTFITSGPVEWKKSSTTDNCMGEDISLQAGQTVTLTKFSDNLWYRLS